MTKLFVGIDWGAAVHSLCCVSSEGERVWETEVRHDGQTISEAVDKVVELAGGDASEVSVAMEAPRGAMLEAFLDQGASLFSINPKQLDRFRDRFSNGGAKDDDLDAFILADTLRTDRRLYRPVVIPEPELVRLRDVNRTYEALTEHTLAIANQVREQLRRFFPQMLHLGRWHEEPWLWELFEKAPHPDAVPRLSVSWINNLLKQHRIRRYKPLEVFDRLNEKPLTLAPGVMESASERVVLLLPLLKAAHQQRAACSERLKELVTASSQPEETDDPEGVHRDAAIILSLPGIGIHNGATMLAEATTALQQRDYQAFRRLTGTAPVSTRTGGRRKKPSVKQRRACSRRLRDAVFHWARVAAQCEPRARKHYRELRARGHSYGRALRGVADRLIKMLFAMLRANELYDQSCRLLPENTG